MLILIALVSAPQTIFFHTLKQSILQWKSQVETNGNSSVTLVAILPKLPLSCMKLQMLETSSMLQRQIAPKSHWNLH